MNKFVFLKKRHWCRFCKQSVTAILLAGCWAVWWGFVISIFVGGKENKNENIWKE